MELFIEKEFLDNFYIEFDSTSQTDNIIKSLITIYGNKKVFIDFKEQEFETLKSENEFFALIANTTIPIPVDDMQEAIKSYQNEQTIVLLENLDEWVNNEVFKNCLFLERQSLVQGINEIIENAHFKVDLSLPFSNWEVFKNEKLPATFFHITDGFLLKDKQPKTNIIPLLKNLLVNNYSDYRVDFLFKELFSYGKENQEKEIQTVNRKLNSVFHNVNVKFRYYKSNLTNAIDFHDRTILSNFSLIDSGVGFSLSNRKVSNSIVSGSTIFEKFTYDRMNRIKMQQHKLIKKLNGDNFDSKDFYKYP